jgi:dipeptide/tripeptide permease
VLLVATVTRRSVEAAGGAAGRAPSSREQAERDAAAAREARLSVPARAWAWMRAHPMADAKFSFFIFCLIPVQTLFAHNWLTLPMYVERAYAGTWIGKNFEVATNFNPIMIFVLVPMVAALTQKRKVYNMMILGTFVMAAPAFLLAFGPHPLGLLAYIVLMTVGEAMWQPRFLQYAAEIAPEGRTGEYMGVAQLPWFLTKVLVPLLYSGYMMDHFCPAEGAKDTRTMWLIFGAIAIVTPILLVIAKNWVGSSLEKKGGATAAV